MCEPAKCISLCSFSIQPTPERIGSILNRINGDRVFSLSSANSKHQGVLVKGKKIHPRTKTHLYFFFITVLTSTHFFKSIEKRHKGHFSNWTVLGKIFHFLLKRRVISLVWRVMVCHRVWSDGRYTRLSVFYRRNMRIYVAEPLTLWCRAMVVTFTLVSLLSFVNLKPTKP